MVLNFTLLTFMIFFFDFFLIVLLTWTFICHYISAVKIALGCCGVLLASACDAKRRVCSFALVLTQKENTCKTNPFTFLNHL